MLQQKCTPFNNCWSFLSYQRALKLIICSQVSVKAVTADVRQLDLDTSGLSIAAVTLQAAVGEGTQLQYELAPRHKVWYHQSQR